MKIDSVDKELIHHVMMSSTLPINIKTYSKTNLYIVFVNNFHILKSVLLSWRSFRIYLTWILF